MFSALRFTEALYLSFAVGAASMTVSKAKLFRPVRSFTRRKSKPVAELVQCPYCTSHWLSFLLTALYLPRAASPWWVLAWFVSAMAIVALSSVTCKLIDWTYSFSDDDWK